MHVPKKSNYMIGKGWSWNIGLRPRMNLSLLGDYW